MVVHGIVEAGEGSGHSDNGLDDLTGGEWMTIYHHCHSLEEEKKGKQKRCAHRLLTSRRTRQGRVGDRDLVELERMGAQ
jgi:hypothetical protein